LQQDIVRRDDRSRNANQTGKNSLAQRPKTASPVGQLASQKRSSPRNAVERESVKPEGRPVADSDHSDLLDAFADYPPEVQREALRRLVAATSKSATKTDQPTGFEAELQKQANHLPELPAARNTAAKVPAIRLGTNQSDVPRQSTSVVSVADKSRPHQRNSGDDSADSNSAGQDKLAHQQQVAQQKIAEMTSRVSDLATGTLEPAQLGNQATNPAGSSVAAVSSQPVVASIGDLPSQFGLGDIQTASATRPAGVLDDSVTRAIPGSVVEPNSAALPGHADSLSDTQLYQALVKQLSTAPAGESEAERSSRMIKLRHLMVLSGDVDSAVKKIEGMSESEQEFLRHQLLGLWTMVDPGGHPVASRRITTALPQLTQATQFAAAATDSLEVRSVSFCTEIESYGQIKPFKSNRFDAGQQVILYCEIENFSAKESGDSYVTEMQGSYDIFNADNQKVVSQLLPVDRQVSSNYLRDYYIAYQMHLPKQLPPGKYRLQLTMEDVGGKKYGQSSIDLEIAK
jgi:hypothetical protein